MMAQDAWARAGVWACRWRHSSGQGSRPVLALLPALKATPCRAWPPAPRTPREASLGSVSRQRGAGSCSSETVASPGVSGGGAQRNWGWLRGIGHLQKAQDLSCAA